MTTFELIEALKRLSRARRETTCDQLIAGNGDAPIEKASVCFMSTAEVIERAAENGSQLLIVHEPVYYCGEETDDDPVVRKKRALIRDSGLAIHRFHDYAHEAEPDFIHTGFLRALGLDASAFDERESLGIRRYALSRPQTAGEIARLVAERLNVAHPQLVGHADTPVSTMCLALGSVGLDNVKVLTRADCDLFVTGEIGDLSGCEYVRDAVRFGMGKAMLRLGHYGSEYAGMRLVAAYIDQNLLPAEFVDGGEVFSYPI